MGAKNLFASRLSQSTLKLSLVILSAGVYVAPVFATDTPLPPADAGPMGHPPQLPSPPSGTGITAGPGGGTGGADLLKTAQAPSSVISLNQSADAKKPAEAKPSPVPAATAPKPPMQIVPRPYHPMPPPHQGTRGMGLRKTQTPLAGIPSSINAISALQKTKLSRLASLLGNADLSTNIQNSKVLSGDHIQALKTLATARFMSIAAMDSGGLAKLVTTLSKTEKLSEAMRAPKLAMAFAGSSRAVVGTLAVLVLAAGPTVTFAEDEGELRLILSDSEGQEFDDILITRD